VGVGQSIPRLDAFEKVTGTARYVEDMLPANTLHAKLLHSTFANGVIKAVNTDKAAALSGVELIVTCFDVPQTRFTTVAHPKALEPERAEIADRLMLTSRVRYYGDDIAVVVARNAHIAKKALKLIEVQYEEYPPLLTIKDAYESRDKPIHEEYPNNNQLAELCYYVQNNKLVTMEGDSVRSRNEETFRGATEDSGDAVWSDETYKVPVVQHAHLENISSFAYMEGRRVVIVTTTQSPHILRRVVSEATGFSVGDIRIIKPYIGGAFGNKQEVLYEPLLAFLTNKLGGRPVCMLLTREETFINSRVRHAMEIRMQCRVSALPGKESLGRAITIRSNKGSYASHGHAVPSHAITNTSHIYNGDFTIGESYSIFTNLPASAAMRGYGIPQVAFAVESNMDELAVKLDIDPLKLRKKFMMKPGFADPFDPTPCGSNKLEQCIDKGAELIGWDQKRVEYAKGNTGMLRRGVGMGIFAYKSCVYPLILENAGCRMILNQNGSLTMQVGATEIGQGSDTVLTQMASEVLRIPENKIHMVSEQDTDVAPYDPGSYASRQTYVTGSAVKKAAQQLRDRILTHAAAMSGLSVEQLSLGDEAVMADGKKRFTLEEVASHSLYNKKDSQYLITEVTHTCHSNAFSFGACFADVEVDVPLGKVMINQIVAVHDSGYIINPKLAKGQMHGGIAMGIGYALSEELLFDRVSGKPLNNNLLDYKIPGAMDIPPMQCLLVDDYEPTGPFGNKSLGEPPLIPTAPAIRNAVFFATGASIRKLPMTPQHLVESFMEHGLIPKIEH